MPCPPPCQSLPNDRTNFPDGSNTITVSSPFFFGIPWWAQFIVAAVVAVALILTLRPPLLRMLRRGGDPARSNIDALIGIDGAVVRTVTPSGGQVRLQNGDVWTARLSPVTEQADVAVGERVLVTGIDGATAVVVPVERSTPH